MNEEASMRNRVEHREALGVPSRIEILPFEMIQPTVLFRPETEGEGMVFTNVLLDTTGENEVGMLGKNLRGGDNQDPKIIIARQLYNYARIVGIQIDEGPFSFIRRKVLSRAAVGGASGVARFSTDILPGPRRRDARNNRMVELNVWELDDLVSTGTINIVGEDYVLSEGLQKNPKTSIDIVDREATGAGKDKLLLEAYRHEIGIQSKILERLIANNSTFSIPEDPLVYNIEEARHVLNGLQEAIMAVPREQLRIAVEEVYVDEYVRLTAETGPQLPYLLGRMVLDLSTVTPYEMNKIMRASNELATIFLTVGSLFGTEYDSHIEDPYHRTIEKMRKEVSYKVDGVVNPSYSKSKTSISSRFYQSAGMDEGVFSQRAEEANLFYEYMQKALQGDEVASPIVQSLLFNKSFVGPHQVHELLSLVFGINVKDGTLLGEENKHIKWQALAKLINILSPTPDRVSTKRRADLAKDTVPIRAALTSMLEGDISATKKPLGDGLTATSATWHFGKEQIVVYTAEHEKTPQSTQRKHLERGKNNEVDITDIFGIALVIDTQGSLTERLGEKQSVIDHLRPKKKREVNQIKAISKEFIKSLLSTLQQDELPLTILKIKDRGDMGGVIEQVGRELGIDIIKRIRSRSSGASDPTWSWSKFTVKTIIDGKEVYVEFQVFPSYEDYEAKLKDDSSYELYRLFIPPEPDPEPDPESDPELGPRFPLIQVFFGLDGNQQEQFLADLARDAA